jgi:hypothetical protein
MALATKPLFRQDLLAEAIDAGAIRFVDVLDDARAVAFRFYESEYALACAMDGQRDINAIIAWADQELGMRPTVAEVQRVVSTLTQLGFLDDGRAARTPHTEDDIITAPVELQPPNGENPHEVITTPTSKIDPAELGPAIIGTMGANAANASSPTAPASGTSGKAVSTNVVSRSGEFPTSKSDGALARVALTTVPAAKAVIPGKRNEEAPAAAKQRSADATTIVSEDELAPGVITAGALSSPRIPVENVELGHVDRKGAADAAEPATAGLDLELGQPGTTTSGAVTRSKIDDVQLGTAGASKLNPPGDARGLDDVSVVLSDHVQLDKGDVRDAVRASQVMKAVDADELERLEKEPAATPAKDREPGADKVAAKPADKAAARTDTVSAAKPAREARPATHPPAASGGSPLKWVAAIAALAATAFLVYNFALKKNDEPANTAAEQTSTDTTGSDKAAADKAAADQAAADKLAADKAAADKLAADKAAADKLAAEQAAAGSAGSAGSAADPAAADKAAADKAAADKAAADQGAADKAAADKAAEEKLAADKAAADKAAADKAATEQAAADAAAKIAADKAAADKAAADKAAADKAAAGGGADAAREAAKKAARAKARAEAAAREKAEMAKLLEKQRKAIEERKKQQGGGAAPAPTP